MKRTVLPFYRLGIHLLWLVCFYFCFRICFFVLNRDSFPEITAGQFIPLLFKGIRFDLSAIFMLNLPVVILLLLPADIQARRGINRLIRLTFMFANGTAFLFEMADWRYFHFNHKRSTADVLALISHKGDFLNLLPGFLEHYATTFLTALVVLFLLFWTYRKTELYFKRKEAILRLVKRDTLPTESARVVRWAQFFIGIGLSVLAIRGGTQYLPLSLANAVGMTLPDYTPILINTPFSIIKTIGKSPVKESRFMPEAEAIQKVRPIKYYGTGHLPFQKKNVVVIILESFSKEFTGQIDSKDRLTPVLDSLMDQGMMFTNAYANGLHSADGIPAILGGIPALMDQLYTLTPYNSNQVTSIASLLGTQGYATAFYHGGTNGTFNFDAFATAAGFEQYFGRKQYHDEKDYDGNWGIYDQPFLQYFAGKLNKTQQPFMAALFTLSSHPPFVLPKEYEKKFAGGKLKIYPTLRYTDWALGNFFKAVRTQSWFKNTLFVITADHCSPEASSEYYCCGNGRYEIPLLFYDPGNPKLKGRNPVLTQQIDLLPSIMDYLHYPDSFYSLGNSVFQRNAPRFVLNRLNGVFNWINDGHQFFMTENSLLEAYQFPLDSLKRNNLAGGGFQPDTSSLNLFHALLQLYEQGLAGNGMTLKRFHKHSIAQ